jgi:hypothetical protein
MDLAVSLAWNHSNLSDKLPENTSNLSGKLPKPPAICKKRARNHKQREVALLCLCRDPRWSATNKSGQINRSHGAAEVSDARPIDGPEGETQSLLTTSV